MVGGFVAGVWLGHAAGVEEPKPFQLGTTASPEGVKVHTVGSAHMSRVNGKRSFRVTSAAIDFEAAQLGQPLNEFLEAIHAPQMPYGGSTPTGELICERLVEDRIEFRVYKLKKGIVTEQIDAGERDAPADNLDYAFPLSNSEP